MKTRYGKDDVSVYRTDGVRTLRGVAVRIDVFGDTFEASYTEGDNSVVVATDTMKNVIHSAALDYEGESLEGLAEHLGNTFFGLYDHLDRLSLRVKELPFIQHSDVLFQRVERDYGVAEVSMDRGGVAEHRSGREGLQLIKITGSSFAAFARDEHTTLPEVSDRPLFIYLDVHWRHADFDRLVSGEDVRDCLVEDVRRFRVAVDPATGSRAGTAGPRPIRGDRRDLVRGAEPPLGHRPCLRAGRASQGLHRSAAPDRPRRAHPEPLII